MVSRLTGRTNRRGAESRRAILEATLQIASQRGYDGTTVAAVTEATGLPASSIYWHFGDKDTLLAETLRFSYVEWRAAAPTWARQPERDEVDAAEEIESRFHRGAMALTTSPEFWQLGLILTLQQRVKEPAARGLYREVRLDTEEAIAAWWSTLLTAEAVAADPELTRRLARFHLMLMDGLFVHVRCTGSRDTQRLFTRLADLLSRELRAQGVLR